jgi:hypothetical protein
MRMRIAKQAFQYALKGRRDTGRPRKRWEAEAGTRRFPAH